MRKVLVLAQLQRVDTTLDRARERLAAVTELLADRSALAEIEAEHAASEAEQHRQQAEQRDLELEVNDLRGKLAALEKKLYGGTVMNSKELGSMTDDAKQYRGQISTREDRLIELYDAVEAATQTATAARTNLEAARQAHAAGQTDLTAERAALQTTLSAEERERQAIVAELDASSLRTYDGLRRTRGGLAVALVSQRTCQGCRVALPIQEEQRARTSEDLVFCQSCGRILSIGS